MSRNYRQPKGQSPSESEPSAWFSAEEEPFFVEMEPSPTQPASASSTPDSTEASAPSWFRKGQTSPPTKPVPPPPPVRSASSGNAAPTLTGRRPNQPPTASRAGRVLPAEAKGPEAELSWNEQLKHWIFGGGGAGYGISMLVHVLFLLILSLWIYTPRQEEEVLVTTLSESQNDVVAFQEIDTEVNLLPEDLPQIKNPLLDPAPLAAPHLGVDLPALTNNADGGGLKFAMPSRVFTKGSFTVWTEPSDPRPGENYTIIVQVKLNDNASRYPRRDLIGSVVGTDLYEDHFGGPTESGSVPVKNKLARLEVALVPGAAQLVKDVIKVKSTILEEEQEIEIIFLERPTSRQKLRSDFK